MTAVHATTSGQRDTQGGRRLRIARWRAGQARARVQEFTVTAGPHATLLDALREIRSHQDSSLTLRYSCCHSSCGTCGMRMNGREVLACVTPLADAGPGPILVEPLANARVEHDLVVDMRDLYDHLEPTGRPLVRQDTSLAGTAEETEAFARFEDCIECGLCVSPVPGSGRAVGGLALGGGAARRRSGAGACVGGRRAGVLALSRQLRVHRGVPGRGRSSRSHHGPARRTREARNPAAGQSPRSRWAERTSPA
jgi:succinate dehydrogenase / fumarate reductase iron-sulfur subunit